MAVIRTRLAFVEEPSASGMARLSRGARISTISAAGHGFAMKEALRLFAAGLPQKSRAAACVSHGPSAMVLED